MNFFVYFSFFFFFFFWFFKIFDITLIFHSPQNPHNTQSQTQWLEHFASLLIHFSEQLRTEALIFFASTDNNIFLSLNEVVAKIFSRLSFEGTRYLTSQYETIENEGILNEGEDEKQMQILQNQMQINTPHAHPYVESIWYNEVALPFDMKSSQNMPSLNVLVLLVGSRGDVQPFIAFAQGLRSAGHRVRYVLLYFILFFFLII
jgi:hypothetical protein